MSAIQDTAYPRFRSDIPQHELDAVYTPTPNEQRWARRCAKQLQQRFFLLVHLKAYQKQGFFCATVDLPPAVWRQLSCPVRDNYDGRLGGLTFYSFQPA